jgi:hypothetical protein
MNAAGKHLTLCSHDRSTKARCLSRAKRSRARVFPLRLGTPAQLGTHECCLCAFDCVFVFVCVHLCVFACVCVGLCVVLRTTPTSTVMR